MQRQRAILHAGFAGEEHKMSRIYINLKNKPVLYENKREKLIGGVCNEILPLSVIKGKKTLKGVYFTDGYRKISSLDILNASQALSVVEGTIVMSEKLKNNLFFPEEYILSPDTVYTDDKLEKYKLAYIPSVQQCRFEKSMSCFIGSMKKYTTPNGILYLDSLVKLADCGNLRYERMVGFIERLKQEIWACGIK